MIREKRSRTLYYLSCDRCGIETEPVLSKKGALRLARKQGWRIEERWNGYVYVRRHTCPWCLQDEENKK